MEVLIAERVDLVFHNKVIDGTAMKRLISRLIDHFGIAYTSHILDQVKTLGFQQATATSISLGIDDLLTTPSKRWLVQDIWFATSQYLRQEMNLNFKITDPSNLVHIMSYSGDRGNASQVHQLVRMRGLMSDPQGQMIDLPIQRNLREGLSLTKYTISYYRAHAGYLTRRLVEVVQLIVVCRTNCGSTRGISVSLQKGMTKRIFIQMLIGHVLANDVYLGVQCIATRNQDIGIGLVNQYIFKLPSLAEVHLGSIDYVMVSQSIGEPRTQLTLRTFHTGGVFTGGTVEYLQAPSNGKIKFNEDLVHPTHTHHGYPTFLCYVNLYVTIESRDIIHSMNIPPKSFLLIQNDQYMESEQVIAEIRVGTSTFHFKERVQKYIYFDSEGEMHWSIDVYHAPEYIHGNVHFLPKTGHLWILLGVLRHKLFGSDPLVRKGRRIFDYAAGSERVISNGDGDFIYPTILRENSYLLAKRQTNRFIIPFQYDLEQEKELTPHSSTSIMVEIPANGILRINKIDSIVKKEGLIEYRRPKESRPKYQMKVDRFFVIPEEVHILPGSSSIMVRNNSIIGVDAQITFNTRSQIGGLKKMDKGSKGINWEGQNWDYVQRITPIKKKYFVLIRPVVTCEIADGINLVTLFPGDMLQEKDNFSIEKVQVSSTEVRANDLTRYFIRTDLVKSPILYIKKRNDRSGSVIPDTGSYCANTNLFSSKVKIKSLSQHQGIIQSIKEKEDTLIPILNLLGPLGTVPKILNFSSSYHSITHNEILLNKYLILDNNNPKQTFQLLKYYLVDENGRISNENPCSDIIFNLFGSLFVKMCLSKHGTHIESGRVIMVYLDSFIIRSAKPYLVTRGATVHGDYGEIFYEGDTLVIFVYEKSRYVLEVRSIDSISMKLEKRVEDWNKYITRIFGIPWGFLIGVELTIAQSHISLVNKIQKVYRSQGVQIHNKHIEIIVR
ncbi:unnamed protein product [Victoria cruziana]